ncbi:MAG: hypothetical protein V1755_15555 [Chloroflexota bacterium]
MPKEKRDVEARQTYTLREAHENMGGVLNSSVRELIEKGERTRPENEMMVYAAHASPYHWLEAGTGTRHQRGEWLIARPRPFQYPARGLEVPPPGTGGSPGDCGLR